MVEFECSIKGNIGPRIGPMSCLGLETDFGNIVRGTYQLTYHMTGTGNVSLSFLLYSTHDRYVISNKNPKTQF